METVDNLNQNVINENSNLFFSNPDKSVVNKENKENSEINPIINNQINQVKLRTTSKSRLNYKKSNQEYIGRDTKVESDLYYKAKDENEALKKHQQQLNEYIKKINANLEKVKHEVLMERKLSDHKVVHLNGGFDVEVETLKMENEKLNEKNKKMQIIIKGLQSQSSNKQLGRKNLINAKTTLENQNDKNEYLKIINHLRDQLKQSDTEVKRLSAEMNISPNKNIKNLTEFNKDLRDKNSQLSELQTKYEKTQLQFETNIKILEHTKSTLEDYISKYNDERKKNLDLENRIQMMESNLAKMPEYISMVEEYKKKERNLEDKIKDLCENPFIKQAEERGNVYRKMQESELSLNEATRRLKVFEESSKNLEKENKILKEQFQIACIDRDKYKEDALRFKISNEERDKTSKNFEEQFKLLGQYGEVDSNFSKILNILKLRDDNTSWMKIDFLDKMNPSGSETKDPILLGKEIERLKIEKGILGTELEKTKSLLQIQQQINEDQVKLSEEDNKILKSQNDKLIKKCEELAQLVDLRGLQGVHANNTEFSNLRRNLLSDILPQEKVVNMMSDAITEFSKDETETQLGMNENALDVYIGEAHFEEGLEKELGIKLNNMMSFMSVDFYLHETETSNLICGMRPIYNLQLSFKVVVDEHLINYLESDLIQIDIYYLKDSIQVLLGKGKIYLGELIKIEEKRGSNTRVINGICQLFYSRDQSLLIGSIHYKMRMRQPLLETVKWYRERNQLLRDVSPVHDVMMNKVAKELTNINRGKSKVMSVTILITKAVGLKLSGPPRRISPYIYYQFYKFGEHFTQSLIGNDPMFQDVMKFDVVYDNTFHDYVEKETVNFYVLDDSRPLELVIQHGAEEKSMVNLIDQPEHEDLIGICKVPLRGLLINDLIQNTFPIYNSIGKVSGELVMNIFWEELPIEDDIDGSMYEGNFKKTNIPYETKTWEDALIVKLAELLKHKGLNLNSAFEIFDRDNKHNISLVNFKDTILFTFKFISNQHELEELTNLVFKNRTSLTKLDFHKIFSIHLPHEGDDPAISFHNQLKSEMSKKNLHIVDNISINISSNGKFHEEANTKDKENKANTIDNIVHPASKRSQHDTNSTNQNMNQKQNSQSNIANVTPKAKKSTIPNLLPDSNRSMKEILQKLNEYMIKTGKSTPLEIYKMFDRDADLKIEKDELANGLSKLGIPVSSSELDRIWKDITENNSRIEKFDYRLFKAFYERYNIKSKSNTA